MRIALASVLIGVDALRANPLRTVLSTLGVIIGVASLVAILALGDGLESYTRQQIATTTDLQTILVDSRTTTQIDGLSVRRTDAVAITPARADSLAAALGDRAVVAPMLEGAAWARVPGDTSRIAVMVAAATPLLAQVGNIDLVAGRFVTGADSARQPRVAVVNLPLASRASGADGPAAALGATVVVDGEAREVVGVVRNRGTAPRVFVPLDGAALARLGENGRQLPSALIKVGRVEDVESVRAAAERWLGRYGPIQDNFRVQSSRERVRQVGRGVLIFKLVMGSIVAISLLVGGIGIMNILLASVAERTREIGIRKAVGATRRDVLLQLLAESVLISGLGAVLGVALGLGGAYSITGLIRRFTEAELYAGFSWGTLAVAALMALGVGVVFGTYPARRAANLSPVDAIRYE